MSLKFCSFASGSSGNCYMIQCEETVLLVDVGISGKKIMHGLETAGVSTEQVLGILITHEHSDHIKSLKTVNKKLLNATTYCNIGTWPHVRELVPEERQVTFESGKPFQIGEITVKPFRISHDAAEPVGYSFFAQGKQISVLTDTGCVTEEIFEEIKDADLVALEANHDKDVLQFCRYPYHIKRRILSDHGHLSNEAAGECICRLIGGNTKKRQILLSHLSNENNTPDIARVTISNIMETAGIYIGGDVLIDVITREEISSVYVL
jgi:phosphoribosyl 1,2-cyclic phosphodiesterase